MLLELANFDEAAVLEELFVLLHARRNEDNIESILPAEDTASLLSTASSSFKSTSLSTSPPPTKLKKYSEEQ